MIYINNVNKTNIKFPRWNRNDFPESYTMVISRGAFSTELIVVDKLISENYIIIDIPSECDLNDGIYEVELYINNKLISTYIMQVGDFIENNESFSNSNNNNKKIIEYNG